MGIQHGNPAHQNSKNMKHAPKWPNPLISGPNSRFKAADSPSLWGWGVAAHGTANCEGRYLALRAASKMVQLLGYLQVA